MEMSSSPPWVDLPTPLTEKILERLPLSDYVRFPAVCRQWRSIQIDHRRRHAPSPPPMLKLPWLISYKLHEEEIVTCYSPFEDRSYRFRIPSLRRSACVADGWLMCAESIVNPISGAVIPFPERFPSLPRMGYILAVSPPPDCVIFMVMIGAGELDLCRQGDRTWTRLPLPVKEGEYVSKAAAFGGNLYCVCSLSGVGGFGSRADHLIVVDPLQMPPAVHFYRMEEWDRMESGFGRCRCIVESGGEVLLVREIYGASFQKVGYQVFRPDLAKRMWTRGESLGGRVIILYRDYSVSLLADDVGLKANCIYPSPNSLYDLGAGTGTFTDVILPYAPSVNGHIRLMFMPSPFKPGLLPEDQLKGNFLTTLLRCFCTI